MGRETPLRGEPPGKTVHPEGGDADRSRRRDWGGPALELSSIFARVSSESLDDAIGDAVARLGAFADADRCYVFLRDQATGAADAETMSNSHEWCAPGIEPQRDMLQRVPVAAWPFWMDTLERREIVNWRVADLPPEARAEQEQLGEQGVRSVVALPMVAEERLVGFVGFDSVRNDRIWDEDEVRGLRLGADLLANALIRLQQEDEARQAREHLWRVARVETLGRLVTGSAHDFNNLLGVILGNCELALEEEDPEQVRALLREIRAATKRASELTRSLLGLGRGDGVRPEPLEVDRVIRASRSYIERILGGRRRLVLDLGLAGTRSVFDERILQHVLLNLAANGRDAMPREGTLTISTRPSGEDGERLVIEVRDDGEGMDAETAAQAFDPFYSTKREADGSGLGLASVRGAVVEAGGAVDLSSVPGVGTSIRLLLPVAGERQSAG